MTRGILWYVIFSLLYRHHHIKGIGIKSDISDVFHSAMGWFDFVAWWRTVQNLMYRSFSYHDGISRTFPPGVWGLGFGWLVVSKCHLWCLRSLYYIFFETKLWNLVLVIVFGWCTDIQKYCVFQFFAVQLICFSFFSHGLILVIGALVTFSVLKSHLF